MIMPLNVCHHYAVEKVRQKLWKRKPGQVSGGNLLFAVINANGLFKCISHFKVELLRNVHPLHPK